MERNYNKHNQRNNNNYSGYSNKGNWDGNYNGYNYNESRGNGYNQHQSGYQNKSESSKSNVDAKKTTNPIVVTTKENKLKSLFDSDITVNKIKDLVADSPFFTSDKLMEYSKSKPDTIKIVQKECPFNENLMIVDISLNPKGVDEDKEYLFNPSLIKNIRRGNTLVETYKYNYQDGDYKLQKTKMVKRGMMKFMDIPLEFIESKDDHYCRTDHIKDNDKIQLRKLLFCPLEKAFSEKYSIEVLKMNKANGENAQISYFKDVNAWVIGSKNVSLLARSREDIELYYPISNNQPNRYNVSYVIAHCWFDILANMTTTQINKLKEIISNKTFIGEYLGNQYFQHIVRYVKHTIAFFAITENDSEKNCMPPKESYEIFKSFGFDVLPVEKLGIYSNMKELCGILENVYMRVAESSIIYESEGSVLYFNKIKENEEENILLCKLKTLEYRVLRKLREKLKNHLLDAEKLNTLNSRRKIFQFFEEVRLMLQGFKLPMPMEFYYNVAETAFLFLNEYPDQCYDLQSCYLDFLEVIMSIIDETIDLKAQSLQEGSLIASDYIMKYSLNSKKVIEVFIYSPPYYLPTEFLEALEKLVQIKIRNTVVENYVDCKEDIVVYHLNMHNFRKYTSLEDNQILIFFGFDENEMKKSYEILKEEVKKGVLPSNPSLVKFHTSDNIEQTMNYFIEKSLEFIRETKKYVKHSLLEFNEFSKENIELYLTQIGNMIKSKDEIIQKLRNEASSKQIKQKKFEHKSDFIETYKNHRNFFSGLKNKFVQKFKNNLIFYKNFEESLSVKQEVPSSIVEVIVVLVPMTIPGAGKTDFIDPLKEIIETQGLGFKTVRSDKIRRDLMNNYMKKYKCSIDKSFDETGRQAAKVFEEQLISSFFEFYENTASGVIYLDKNHPPNAIVRTFDTVFRELNQINTKGLSLQYVALVPDCSYPFVISNNKKLPFSLSYIIQCYLRVRFRKNHETLNGDKENLICIFGMFISNFINMEFDEKTLILHYNFKEIVRIPFAEEIEEIPKDIVDSARDFFGNIKGGSIPDYDDRAKKLCRLIEGHYKDLSSFKNTKQEVKKTVDQALTKIFDLLPKSMRRSKTQEDNLPKDFLYLGLKITSKLSVIQNIVLDALDAISETYQISVINVVNDINEKGNGYWRYAKPDKTLHITTYFKNKTVDYNSPPVKDFRINKEINPLVLGVAYIPNELICLYVDAKTSCTNKYPHITFMINSSKPKDSNDALTIIQPNLIKQSLNELSINWKGRKCVAYYYKLKSSISLSAIMKGFTQ